MNNYVANDPTAVEIPGLPGYHINPKGDVYGLLGYPLKPAKATKGEPYLIYLLKVNGKTTTFHLHKLLAITFIPLPEGYELKDVMYISRGHRPLLVDHIDGNASNNDLTNLRWVTAFDNSNNPNSRRAGAPKGNDNAKGHKGSHCHNEWIYTYNGKDYQSAAELAEALGCSKSRITESFRKNIGLVARGLLTRRVK